MKRSKKTPTQANAGAINEILARAKARSTWHYGMLDSYASKKDEWHNEQATPSQRELLARRGFEVPENLTKGEADHLINKPSPKQRQQLENRALWHDELSFSDAHQIMKHIANDEGWYKRPPIS